MVVAGIVAAGVDAAAAVEAAAGPAVLLVSQWLVVAAVMVVLPLTEQIPVVGIRIHLLPEPAGPVLQVQ